jgi:hypothetical protein
LGIYCRIRRRKIEHFSGRKIEPVGGKLTHVGGKLNM